MQAEQAFKCRRVAGKAAHILGYIGFLTRCLQEAEFSIDQLNCAAVVGGVEPL